VVTGIANRVPMVAAGTITAVLTVTDATGPDRYQLVLEKLQCPLYNGLILAP